MTIDDAAPQEVLDENVGRLFDRLKRQSLVSPIGRDRILERLLNEAATPRSTRSGAFARRWVRWAGLAAALFVGAALLTGHRDEPARSGGLNPAPGRAGSVTTGPAHATLVSFAIHLMATGPGPGVVEAASAQDGEPVPIHSKRQVSDADVQSARVGRTASGCQVDIRLTEEGTGKLTRLTRDHIGERLALVIDGKVVMTPTIRSEITEGQVALTGDFTDARCEEIARGLSTQN
jgi:SecDF, P1 head subdomain